MHSLPTYLPYTKAAVALPTTLRVEIEVEVRTLGDDAWALGRGVKGKERNGKERDIDRG